MSHFDRRQFLQASALGLSSLISPAVLSKGIDSWPFFNRRFLPQASFQHGVASGDPLSDSVILWTRVSPEIHKRSRFRFLKRRVLVGWEVAMDPHFNHIIRRGSTLVSKKTDYTLKVDVVGLWSNQEYYYRFRTFNAWSPVGRTKTLPVGDVSEVKLAVMSCSNYPAGYFNVYSDAAQIPNLDAVVHLGDYIYEYGVGGYATELAEQIGRGFEDNNNTEIFSLADYRRRYAQYRTDTGLQNLHAAAPFICVWDDHEVANDTWKEGAENHNEGEGSFTARKRRALRAYFEWMPIRPVQRNNREIIYRQFQFGNLVDLMMLDTRIIGRDQQLDLANYVGTGGSFNAAQFAADVANPNRTLLGFEQRNWLLSNLQVSPARWQVLGQQVLMGRMTLPAELLLNLTDPAAALTTFSELALIKGRILAGDPTVTDIERARVETTLPYNLDAWDGYFAEREAILATAAATDKNLVVLAGDTHNAWANNLSTLDNIPVGVEFATASVTSPGFEDFLQLPPVAYPQTEAGFELLIDQLQYMNVGDRGYLVVTFTPEETRADWQFINNILSEEYTILNNRAKSLKVSHGTKTISEA